MQRVNEPTSGRVYDWARLAGMIPLSPQARPHGLSKTNHVAGVLRDRINTRAYSPGDPLPSEPHLVEEFGYDRSTIRRGLAVLRQEGLITSEHGKGVFVRKTQTVRHELLHVLRSEYEHVRRGRSLKRGIFEETTGVHDGALTVEPITYQQLPADDDLAHAFGIEAGTDLLERRYPFNVNGEPHQITRSFLLYEMVKGTPLTDPSNERAGQGTLAQLLTVDVLIDAVSVDISARMPNPDETAELRIPEGTPLLVDRRRSTAKGRTVCVADTITPADRITYGLDLQLGQGVTPQCR